MKEKPKIPRHKPLITAKSIWIALSLMILVHLATTIFYTVSSRRTQHELNQERVKEQIVNVLELIRSTPAHDRVQLLKSIYIPYINIEINAQSKFKNYNATPWQLKHKLSVKFGHIKLSYLLDDGNWVNMDARIVSRSRIELQITLIILELAIATALIFSAWSVNRFTEPLIHFKEVANSLGVNSNTNVLIEHGSAVVRETAEAMHKMQLRIQQLLTNRTKMLAAISHDLRTPITRLKLRAQYIPDIEQQQKMEADLDEMEKMIGQILAYAKSDYEQGQSTNVDLNSLLQSIADEYSDYQHNVIYHSGDVGRVIIVGKRLGLKRAFNNLINNAIRYASQVDIHLQKNRQQCIVTIEDNGPGIPESELEHITEPFYRPDRSRSTETGGVGLGLAVVQDILLHHQASIAFHNKVTGGLCVTITFNTKL